MKTTEMDKTKLETTSLEQGMGKWVKLALLTHIKTEKWTDLRAKLRWVPGLISSKAWWKFVLSQVGSTRNQK